MRRPVLTSYFVVAVLECFTACSKDQYRVQAERAVEEFHQRVALQQYHELYIDADDELKQTASEAAFSKLLGDVQQKLGKRRRSMVKHYQHGWFTSRGLVITIDYDSDFDYGAWTLIFSGKTGRGKTHLAIAIAYRAIQNGFDAFFTTAAALIDDLSAAFRQGQLAEALALYTHPAVVVVDEIGYLTYGTDAANMLFHVVNERHRRRRSMIFTTNKALKAWGRVLHDEDLGQAIIDRALERGRLIRLDGPSVRTLHLKLDDTLKDDSDQDDEVARISGNKWPEFPEPTELRGGAPNALRAAIHFSALRRA